MNRRTASFLQFMQLGLQLAQLSSTHATRWWLAAMFAKEDLMQLSSAESGFGDNGEDPEMREQHNTERVTIRMHSGQQSRRLVVLNMLFLFFFLPFYPPVKIITRHRCIKQAVMTS